jgi:capsular exopolysaccharide synthesis family protein
MVKDKKHSRPTDDDIDISGLMREISERRLWFIISLIFCMSLSFLYIKFKLPVYEASASVLIQESNQPAMKVEDFLMGDLFGDQANIATEKGIIGSRSVMFQTIRELDLGVSYYNTSVLPYLPRYKKQPFIVVVDSTSVIPGWIYDKPFSLSFVNDKSFKISISTEDDSKKEFSYNAVHDFGKRIITDQFQFLVKVDPSIVRNEDYDDFEFIIHSESRQVNEYLTRLKIESPDKDATIVKLTFQDEIPQRAVDILNKLCEVYINLDIQDKTSVASLTLQFVDEQLEKTSEVVKSIEAELQEFKEENKTVNLSEESKSFLDRLNTMDVEKMKSDIELRSLNNLYNYVSSNVDMTEMAPSALGIPDPLLIELISKFQELQDKRKSLSYGVKSVTPAVRVIDQQIADTRASLLENIRNIQSNVKSTNQTLTKQLRDYESRIRQVPEIERDLLSIQRKFEVNQNIYIYLLQKKAETSIAKAAAISDNKILDQAVLSEEPVEPNKRAVLLLGLLLSGILPLSGIFLQKFFRTTVGSREELTRLTDIPVLGVVGHAKETDNLIVQHQPKSRIAEAFRSVRTNLQFFGGGNGNKIILITSSVGGEGKSFVTINLASVLAMQDYKVLIVGLDLRKPKLFQDYNISNDEGVSTYLIGNGSLNQLIKPTGVANLDMIPSGPIPPNPSELISKPEMEKMFAELSDKYDFIVVDTPPVGIVSDAFLLMKHSHINVYVVREGYSRKDYITSLNDQFHEGRFKNLCLLMNDSGFGKSYGYGYGNYGYGNGSGYYDDEDNSKGIFSKLTGKA